MKMTSLQKLLALSLVLLATHPVSATPEFARRYGATSCTTCHTVVPKLNARGLDFLARGYRPDPDLNVEEHDTVPLSVWLNARYENEISEGKAEAFFRKAELISGGGFGDGHSYFVEVLYEGEGDEKEIEFEDVWLSFRLNDRNSLTVGQYRPLTQIEPGRRISISVPALFSTRLEGREASSERLTDLREFATGSRSPAISWQYQSIQGEGAADGLFHTVTVPFPGSLSIGLNEETREETGFDFDGRPKGVLLETYYREKLNSIGAHAFIGDGRWLVAGLGTYQAGDVYFTAGLGLDHADGDPDRVRTLLGLEYLPTFESDTWRPGFGFRVEGVSNSGNGTAYVPYFALSAPNGSAATTLLQLEYFGQKNHEELKLDLSIIF